MTRPYGYRTLALGPRLEDRPRFRLLREETRHNLQKDIEAYFARGGKITHLPPPIDPNLHTSIWQLDINPMEEVQSD